MRAMEDGNLTWEAKPRQRVEEQSSALATCPVMHCFHKDFVEMGEVCLWEKEKDHTLEDQRVEEDLCSRRFIVEVEDSVCMVQKKKTQETFEKTKQNQNQR